MTVDEIKSRYTMADILSTYGIRTNRAGMCCCPFHQEKTPSCKIYKDGFKCFACGAAGDIFKFVQLYEGCSFKDAFLKLGGEYEQTTERKKTMIKVKAERARRQRELKEQDEEKERKDIQFCLDICIVGAEVYEAFTDQWCFFIKNKELLENIWECKYIRREEVSERDVRRICKRVRQYINT